MNKAVCLCKTPININRKIHVVPPVFQFDFTYCMFTTVTCSAHELPSERLIFQPINEHMSDLVNGCVLTEVSNTKMGSCCTFNSSKYDTMTRQT